jgi:signal peptidase
VTAVATLTPHPLTVLPAGAPAAGARAARVGGGSVLGSVLRSAALAAVTVVVALVGWTLLPALGGWQPSVVLSDSMAPRIASGDVVVSAAVDPAELRAGQVVLFTRPDGTDARVMHRIVAVLPDGSLRTRGDANAVADTAAVPADHVLGLPRLRVPYVGLPMLWLRQDRLADLVVLTAVAVAVVALLPQRQSTPPRRTRRRA